MMSKIVQIRKVKIYRVFFIFFFIPTLVGASYWEFGQNKVQYKDFHWRVIDTEEFSIIYSSGGEGLARFAQEVLLDSYQRLSWAFSRAPEEPIPVILYNSHNDFEQTNITLSLIDESTGGFTEIYKNRVVVPFTGSYEAFRHVLSHELVHAFQFGVTRGSGIASIFPKITLYSIPLWFIEGMAEYLSLSWDAESDMIIRDAIYYDHLFPIDQLYQIEGSYLMYKEGQAILKFIADRYGEKKIGEIFHKIGLTGGLDKAVESVLGVDLEELSSQWIGDLKKRYWGLCAEKEEIPPYTRRLTKHQNYTYNIAPVISPDGTEIIFLSDRDQYDGLYLMSSINGRIKKKLVGGGKSDGFESLYIFHGGIGWDAEGKKIAFVAKSSGHDVLYIMDVSRRKIIKKFSPDLDGIFSPAFSPARQEIAIRGLKDGYADIYVLNIETGKLSKLTDDKYDDLTPGWSPDGTQIVFSSDRPLEGESWYYGHYNLFQAKRDDFQPAPLLIERTTLVASPLWIRDEISEEDKIFFISNRTGINNLYELDIKSLETLQLTDVIGGVFTPSISKDGKYIAFSLYTNMGWDVFTMKSPSNKAFACQAANSFDRRYAEVEKDSTEINSEKLGLRLTPDWGGGALSYVYGGGFYGYIRLAISDLLGNHRFYIETNSPENLALDFYINYFYLPKRLDVGGAVFKHEYSGLFADTLFWEKTQGAGILFEYPLDRFRRIELEFDGYIYDQELWSFSEGDLLDKGRFYQFYSSLSYVIDNSIWGLTGPQNGERAKFKLLTTLPVLKPTLHYNFYEIDLRKYIRLHPRYCFALRLINAGIWGQDKDKFNIYIGGSEDLRGYEIGEFKGKNVGILNLELRYPFIDKLKIAFPLPISISGIRGVLFCDFGYATDDIRNLRFFENGMLKDLKFGFGTGIRVRFPYLVLKLDVAKNTDLLTISSETYWHFSLYPDF